MAEQVVTQALTVARLARAATKEVALTILIDLEVHVLVSS
jgi:hypothetical protein